MADDVFQDWQPNDPPYKAAVIAANFRAIRKQILDVLSTGGRDIIVGMSQVGRALTFTTAAGRTLTGASLPLAPVDPRGERVVGRYYDESDLYRVNGSSYIALVGHNATSSLAADVAAGKVTLYAAAGADAENYRGQYLPGQAYSARDVVYTGNPGTGLVSYYKAFFDVPSGGAAPPDFPWGLSATYLRDVMRGFAGGTLGAGKRIWQGLPAAAATVPFGFAGSRFVLGTAAAAALTLSLRKNGIEVGTVGFAAGGTVGTIAVTGAILLAATDVLSLHAPATADATAADLSLAIVIIPNA